MAEILTDMIITGKTTLEKISQNPKFQMFRDKIITLLNEKGRGDLV